MSEHTGHSAWFCDADHDHGALAAHEHTGDDTETLGRLTTIRLPETHAVDAETGMNVGDRHYHVAVDVDPSIEHRGEQRHVGYGAHVVLRDLDEHADQVLLHELLHVITSHVVPADTFGPDNHRLISHLEVALWEAGYRRPSVLPHGCGICGQPLDAVGTSACYEAHVIPPAASSGVSR